MAISILAMLHKLFFKLGAIGMQSGSE